MQRTVFINIGLIMYPDVQQSTVLGLIDFFSIVNQVAKKYLHTKNILPQINIIKIDEPVFHTNLPSFIVADTELDFSAIIIPPCFEHLPLTSECKAFVQFLRYYSQQGAIIGAIDNGTFLLAETNLLDNSKASIHWQYEDKFKRRFPSIEVDVDTLLTDEKKIITTAGLLSWNDLALQLTKRFFGPVIMADIANRLFLQPSGRAQSYFSVFHPCTSHGDEAILKGQKWIVEHNNLNITLDELAQVTNLEIRTLQRRFMKATGMTITEYLQRYRMSQAQALLQFTNKPVDLIGVECGYKDSNAFRKIFIKVVGLSPNLYRKNFSV